MNCMWISAGANCFRRWGFALAVLALAGATAGCVERRMTIRSNPPGAQVYVDDYEIGTAPVSTSYTYYGTRKIRLVKDGYETLTVYQPMPAPWYGWPGIDFFSENLWPHKIRDERSFEYQLSPMIIVPTEELQGAGGATAQRQPSGAGRIGSTDCGAAGGKSAGDCTAAGIAATGNGFAAEYGGYAAEYNASKRRAKFCSAAFEQLSAAGRLSGAESLSWAKLSGTRNCADEHAEQCANVQSAAVAAGMAADW